MALRLSEVKKIECKNGRKLIEWLRPFSYFAEKRIHVVENFADKLRIHLYTARHHYSIVVTESGYLGCTAACRTPRPGEDWTRGNDLPDGDFCKETLHEILGAIVFYEALETVRGSDEQNARIPSVAGAEAQG